MSWKELLDALEELRGHAVLMNVADRSGDQLLIVIGTLADISEHQVTPGGLLTLSVDTCGRGGTNATATLRRHTYQDARWVDTSESALLIEHAGMLITVTLQQGTND